MATKSKKTKKGNGTAVAKSSKKTTKKITSNMKKTTKTANKKLTAKTATIKNNKKLTANSGMVSNIDASTLINNNINKEININTIVPDSGTTIYFDHDKAKSTAGTVQECFETITRDNREIQSIISDINQFWRGTLATKFENQFEGYMAKINSYNQCLQDAYDNLKNGSEAYSSFDEYFASKNI